MYYSVKKYLKILVVALVLSSNSVLAAKQAVITASSLNVRESASTSAKVITKVEKNDKFNVIEESGDWIKISVNSTTGFVSKEYVNILEVNETTTTKTIRYVSAASLNVRSGDSVEAKVLLTLKNNDEVEILELKTEWAKVKVGNVEGWVSRQYLKASKSETQSTVIQEKYVKITTASLNVRKTANTASEKVGTLIKGKVVKVLATEGEWYKIEFEGTTGYIVSEYTSVSNNTSSRGDYDRSDVTVGSIIVDKALKYLGYRYVYGGESPSGFDCSGFVYYLYKDYVKNLPRSATPQSKIGEYISKANLKKGDLVFFGENGGNRVTHVGIYIDNGMFIHAATPARGVIKDTLNSGYYSENYLTARRIVD